MTDWQAEIDKESRRKYPDDPDRKRLQSKTYCAGKIARHAVPITYREYVDADSGIPHIEKAKWWLRQLEEAVEP